MESKSIYYHSFLSKYFKSKPLYLEELTQQKPNTRKLVEQPWQQTTGEMWDEVTETLCNLDFIQAKAAAKMTYELINNFNEVLEVIPDNAETIRKEKDRLERIEIYMRDLILYSKGEIRKLNVPKSVSLWREEQINSEIERIETNPTRADMLKVFKNFLGQQVNFLDNFAYMFPGLVIQQAWNNYNTGPVGKEANRTDPIVLSKLILRIPSTRPGGDYLPLALKTLAGHNESVNSVAFTPNGKLAVSGSGIYDASYTDSKDNTCILWDLETCRPIKTLKGHADSVLGISITPDGKNMISASRDKTLILWDLNSGQIVKTLKAHQGTVNAVSITSNGNLAVSASDDLTCILWDIQKGKPLKILKGHQTPISKVVISSDGKVVVSKDQFEIILWNLQTGKPQQSFSGHHGYINAIAMTSDGRFLVSGSQNGVCILWDTQNGEIIRTFNDVDSIYSGNNDRINAVSITHDGKYFISASDQNTFILWDTQFGYPIRSFIGHSSDIIDVIIAPDAKFALSSSKDKTCILWDLECSQPQRNKTKAWPSIATIENIPDKKLIESNIETEIQKINPFLRFRSIKLNDSKTHWISVNIVSSDGEILESFSDYLDTFSDRLELEIEIYGGKYIAKVAAISPDEIFGLLSMGNEECILWDLVKDQPMRTLKGHTGKIISVAISMNGKIGASTSTDKTCILWDLETGKVLNILLGHTSQVIGVAFTPNGKHIITTSCDGICIIWDLETVEKKAIFYINQKLDYFSLRKTGLIIRGINRTFIEHHFLEIPNFYLNNGEKITTLRLLVDPNIPKYQKLSADCPSCFTIFCPEESILLKIDKIKKEAGLMPEESSCIKLPKKIFDEPELISNCPKCGEQVRFNPFIVDHTVQYYFSEKKNDKLELFFLNNDPSFLREEAFKQFKFGRYKEANRILQLLLSVNYEILSTRIHLARIALISDNVTEVNKQIKKVWDKRKDIKPYLLARVLWFRLYLKYLESGDQKEAAVIIGQLKTLLQNEEAIKEWTMKSVLDHLRPQIYEHQHSFLSALVNALNAKQNLEKLNEFAEWREAKV